MDNDLEREIKSNKQCVKEIENLKLQLALPSTTTDVSTKGRKPIVLDEDEYREKLDKIIERDFFPDVEKLRFELEYNEAVENNDFAKIRELNDIREAKLLAGNETPAGFETPSFREQYLKKKNNNDKSSTTQQDGDKEISLSKFLNKYTSEDNDSLEQLMAADERKREEKMKFMTKDGEANDRVVDKMIELPSIDEQRALKNGPGNMENRSVTWKYKDRNNVMFVPEEAPLTEKEIAQRISNKPIIRHENTRFKKQPVIFGTGSTAATNSTNQSNASGRIGIDGNPLSSSLTPQVGGFKFVPATPLVDPNYLDTPNQMTWGTIDATPMRLDEGSATPRAGAFFKIPEIAKRELLEQELQEQVLAKKRKNTVPSSSSKKQSSSVMNSAYDRLSTMSPAAQRLASATLGIRSSNDRSLQASYSTFSGTRQSSSAALSATPSPFGNRRPSRTPTPQHNRSSAKATK